MNTIWPVALISFQQGLKNRILYGIMIFAFLLMATAVLFSGLFLRDILKITLDLCLSAISIGGLLIPIFIAISLFSGDLEQKSIYTILARPISRTHYIIGKYIGLVLLTAMVIGVLTVSTLLTVWVSTFIYASYFFAKLSVTSILISSLMTLIGILLLNSTVMLWCSVTTSSFLATLLTLATYLVGVTIESVVRFVSLKLPGVEISPVITKIVNILPYIFPNLAAFDFKQQAAHGLSISLQECLLAAVYGGAYIISVLALTVLIFQQRDLS